MAAMLEVEVEINVKGIFVGPSLGETLLSCMVTKAKYLIFGNGF